MRSDGYLDFLARVELASILKVDKIKETSQIAVTRGRRDTLASMPNSWRRAGLRPPQATDMLFRESQRLIQGTRC